MLQGLGVCLLLSASLLASAASERTNWRWCGHIGPAIHRPAHYRLATGTTAQTALTESEIRVEANGELYCRCPTHLQAPPTELRPAVIIAVLEGGNNTSSVIADVLNPCTVAVCRETDQLQLSQPPLKVEVLPSACGVKVEPQSTAGKTTVVATGTNTSVISGGCYQPDGQLIISQAVHVPHPNHPPLVILQSFPMDLSTCAAISDSTAHISLQSLDAITHTTNVVGLHQQVRRQAPPQFGYSDYTVSVRENSPVGTMVTTVQASGSGAIIYTMTPMNPLSVLLFSLDTSTGVITTTGGCSEVVWVCMASAFNATDGIHELSLNYMNVLHSYQMQCRRCCTLGVLPEFSCMTDYPNCPLSHRGTYSVPFPSISGS